MSWNHRVLAFEGPLDEVVFQIHEVYYYPDNTLRSYTESPAIVLSGSIKGIRWTLNQFKKALEKPVIWGGEKFPEIYE